MFNRLFKSPEKLSFFLFGARATGKSTLLKELLPPAKALWFDLLDLDLESRFQLDPMALEREILSREKDHKLQWVVIDEIQKIPKLLDIVHRQIERKRFRFALTGSSARKLKRGAANLLAGRATQNFLFPLTYRELGERFDLNEVLQWGSLPILFGLSNTDRVGYLKTYSQTYLREEVIAEQLIRNTAPFRAFLPIAAQCSGTIINYSKIARDTGSDPVTIKTYFEILEDTLVGFRLPAYEFSVRKQQRTSPKFYFFDLGVQRALANVVDIPVRPRTYEYGQVFEQFIMLEVFRLNHYLRKDYELSYLQTKEGVEVDLIINIPRQKPNFIEIKSTDRITEDDVRSLATLTKGVLRCEPKLFSNDPRPQTIHGVSCLHWREGLEQVFGG